jgi:hypothetical protein
VPAGKKGGAVCLITGVGDITARCFATGGCRIAMLAPDKPDEFFAKPSAIADEIFHIAQQDGSAWSFDVTVRPYHETW